MGRLNFNQLKYFLRQFTKIIPYKYRKPFYLVGGILGLVGWFNFLVFVTQSKYLFVFKEFICSFITYVIDNFDHRLVVLITAIMLFYFCVRYFRTPKWEEQEAEVKYEHKKRSNGSIYYQVNSLISILYLLFLILAFLPLII